MYTAKMLIDLLALQPLAGEGGYFRQTWVAGDTIPASGLPARYGRAKPAGTAIYYLVTDADDGFSALHRLPTDEVYHFYLGDPVEQLLLHPDGRSERVILGSDLVDRQRVQHVAPAGSWQGTRLVPGGRVALLGTTMAPGFDPMDFEPGDRAALTRTFPAEAALIAELTRP
jgi:predicted cupin superfamily sugar epimerase